MKGLHEQYGIPEYYERLQSQIPKIDALNRQMIDLQTREQQSLMASEQRMAPMTFIRGEQALIQRQYAVEKASVAAQLGAETALAEMYKGNINMARTLIGDVVQALTYDYNQQVADWEMNFNLYQDYFSALDSSTQKSLDMAYNEIVRQRDRKEKEYYTLLNAWLELKAQGVEPFPFNKIKNMDYEEGMKKIAETIAAQPAETDMLSVAEAKSLGVPYGTTRAQAMGMGLTPGTGETGWADFTDLEKRKLMEAGVDWTTPGGYQEALNHLYGEKDPTAKLSSSAIDRIVAKSHDSENIPIITEETARQIASSLRAGLIPENLTPEQDIIYRTVLEEMLKETSLDAALRQLAESWGITE